MSAQPPMDRRKLVKSLQDARNFGLGYPKTRYEHEKVERGIEEAMMNDAMEGEPKPTHWTCRECKTITPFWYLNCHRCGKEKATATE